MNLTQIIQEKLSQSDQKPLYKQLQKILHEVIRTQLIGFNDALPPERQLALDLGISRITVRKAIDNLVDEGVLTRRQGSGNYVNHRIDKNFAALTTFSEDMYARGLTPRSEWLKRGVGTATPEESIKLSLSLGSSVLRFHRLRFADDAPMSIERATLTSSALPSVDVVGDSLYEALGRYGNRPVRAIQRLHAMLLNEEQARLLLARPKDAGLFVERIGYSSDGRAVELSQSTYRGDAYDFLSELGSTSQETS